MSFAFALNRSGKPRRALVEIDAALDDLGSRGRAEGLAQRAAILQQLGRLNEALSDYRVALPALRREGDLGVGGAGAAQPRRPARLQAQLRCGGS